MRKALSVFFRRAATQSDRPSIARRHARRYDGCCTVTAAAANAKYAAIVIDANTGKTLFSPAPTRRAIPPR